MKKVEITLTENYDAHCVERCEKHFENEVLRKVVIDYIDFTKFTDEKC